MFDDVVEHCGEGAHKYLSACFPAFMDGVAEVCCKTSCTVARLTQVTCVVSSNHTRCFVFRSEIAIVRETICQTHR